MVRHAENHTIDKLRIPLLQRNPLKRGRYSAADARGFSQRNPRRGGELRSGNAAPKPKNRRNPNALPPPPPRGRGRGRGIAGKDPPLPNFALPDFRRGSHPTAAPLVCQGRKKQALAPVSNGRCPRIGPQTADRISRTESDCRAVKPDRPDRAVAASCRPTGAAKGSTFGRIGGARELRRAQFGR